MVRQASGRILTALWLGWALAASGAPINGTNTWVFSSSFPFTALGFAAGYPDPNHQAKDGWIPDNAVTGWADVINATGFTSACAVVEVKVNLNFSGGYNGDLYAYLLHGSQKAVLLNRVGRTAADPYGYEESGMSVQLADSAAGKDIHRYKVIGGSITNGAQWQPDGRNTPPASARDTDNRTSMLAVFTNAAPEGDWTLFVSDMDGGFQSRLTSWGLELAVNQLPTPGAPVLARTRPGGAKAPVGALLGTDRDGDLVSLSTLDGASAQGGTVARIGNWIVYAPAAGWTNDDAFGFAVGDGRCVPQAGSATVAVKTDAALLPQVRITDLGDAGRRLNFAGIPGKSYTVTAAADPEAADWQAVGQVTADAFGSCSLHEPAGGSGGPRVYRVSQP